MSEKQNAAPQNQAPGMLNIRTAHTSLLAGLRTISLKETLFVFSHSKSSQRTL
jgi:hypothetical protein